MSFRRTAFRGRQLIANSLVLSLGTGSAQALTAASYWVTARNLRPADFGKLAAAVSLAMLLWSAADLGFNSWLIREMARGTSADTFGVGLGARLALAVLAASLWLACSVPLWLLGDASRYVPLLALWVLFSLIWSTLAVPLRAAERMGRVAAISVVERVVLCGVVAVSVAFGDPALGLVVGLVLGAAIAMLVAWSSVGVRVAELRVPTLQAISSFVRASLGFAASSLAVQLQRLDVPLVSLAAGPSAAGIYAAPARVTNVLGILPTSFSSALFPRVSRAKGGAARGELRFGTLGVALTMAVLIAPLFWFAPSVAGSVLGVAYRSSGAVLRPVLVAALISSVNQPISVAFQARGRERSIGGVFGVGVAIGLTAIALGGVLWGALGAACGLVAMEFAIFCGLALVATRSNDGQTKASRLRALSRGERLESPAL